MSKELVEKAKTHFGAICEEQLERVERMKKGEDWVDYSTIKPIIIGSCYGDGIGPIITQEAQRILEYLLQDELKAGKVEFRTIDGLTIEYRAEKKKAIPEDVLKELMACNVVLKAPTTTPEKGDEWPNIESANVAMRKYMDLFANVRPVRIPREGIDWMFFRENTEGAYVMGSRGCQVSDDLAIDFKVITRQGADRIIRMAFDYASKKGINDVTVVTKANVVKTTDGLFLDVANDVAKEYPDVKWEGWYIDIMTAKLIDPKRRNQFRVMVLPNLYGDILTDEAAEMQGGVGTAGSANIGKRYAMFEAIHGSAPRMIKEGRGKFADPCSMVRAGAMLLDHIGYPDKGEKLAMALDICGQYEKKMVMTGRDTGCTGEEFGNYLMDTMNDSKLKERWDGYVKAETQ